MHKSEILLEHEGGAKMHIHDNVGIQADFYGRYIRGKNDTLQFKALGRAVLVKRCIKNLESGHESLELSYQSNTQKKATLKVDRGELVRSSASKFLRHGIDAFEDNMPYLLKTIQQQECQVGMTHTHDGIGWMEYEGKKIYRGNELITPKGMDLQSTYEGKLDIIPKGSFKTFMTMVRKEIIGRVPLEFALCMGVSAIVTGYLQKELGNESFLYHIGAESSSGKTTAGQLAISVSSNPTFSAESLMTNWNSTANYRMALLRNNQGMMVLFDEASTLGNKDITNTIYDLAGGKERGRMSKDLSVAETGTWGTTFMSTGEGSLKGYMNQNSGLSVRVLESLNENWTDNAKNADAIKQCVTENYGLIGPVIAKHLVNKDYNWVKKAYEKNVQLCYESLVDKTEFADRIAKKLGVILYSAELLQKVFKLNINKDGIKDFLIRQQEVNEEERDLGLKAYYYILEEVASNINKFYRREKNPISGMMEDVAPKNEVWGKIRTLNKGSKVVEEIAFIPIKLHEILARGGFTNPTTIAKKLKEKGLLDCEANKCRRKRKLPHTKGEISVYCILVEIASITTSASEKRKAIERHKQAMQETVDETVEDIFDQN